MMAPEEMAPIAVRGALSQLSNDPADHCLSFSQAVRAAAAEAAETETMAEAAKPEQKEPASEAPPKPKQTKAEKAYARRKELLDSEFRWGNVLSSTVSLTRPFFLMQR